MVAVVVVIEAETGVGVGMEIEGVSCELCVGGRGQRGFDGSMG